MTDALLETNLNLPNKRSGKVRDLYDVTLDDGGEALLIVATDRISAFDVVMANGLPGKGVVLTQISKFWFDLFAADTPHHLVSTDPADVPGLSAAEREALAGRIMLCRKTEVVPIECIARGYITGSGWKDYKASGSVCGIALPAGLRNSDRLEEPLFTPSTKADTGHDENISFDQGVEIVGRELMEWLGETTLRLYRRAGAYALERGIILADTKFEFGRLPGQDTPILIDEIFTPDSSRFWPADQWVPGREQESFDKQIVRNYLETVVAAGEWDKTPPGPTLPDEVVARSVARYEEAYRLLTGSSIR
ncbi:MAG: phosphoribosylaminoimidazolesuccinocarboxamide synthase [Gammaproteobacteria bacterium]|nr:phosphoribosylaminoimidazolesuccinocarboxamide synthase [Gammaproteobacteria bacterium]